MFRVKNPTIDFANIRMMFVPDPLGSPYNASNILWAVAGEQTVYNDSTLNEFLDEMWPSDSTVQLVKSPRAGLGQEGGSSMDAVQTRYPNLCGDNCLPDGGVPAIWLMQPSFQKYRT
jgi:hypothetical protein